MMRRTFWVGVGAAAGISGYRRVARGLSALTGPGGGRRGAGTPGGPDHGELELGSAASATGGQGPAAAGPARSPAPGGAAAASARLGLRLVRGSGRVIRRQLGQGAAGFVGDVRDGMSEYLEQHSLPSAPTLDRQQLPAGRPDAAALARRFPGIDYVKDGH